jgi:hypothetical protein
MGFFTPTSLATAPVHGLTFLWASTIQSVLVLRRHQKQRGVMNPIETEYRNHKIVIRDEIEFASDDGTGALDRLPVTKRVIEVDGVDVTNRCRMSNTDEQKAEEARRFIDRIYPKGKSEAKDKGR